MVRDVATVDVITDLSWQRLQGRWLTLFVDICAAFCLDCSRKLSRSVSAKVYWIALRACSEAISGLFVQSFAAL